jgi:hypothetical protein
MKVMKKIFTLMLAAGSISFVSAQSMAKNDRSGRNDNGSNKEMKNTYPEVIRGNQNDRSYTGTNKTYGNDDWSNGNRNGKGNNNDSYGKQDQRDSRAYDERRRQEETDRINREYDKRIKDYRNDRRISSYERNKWINHAERERMEMIKSLTGAATVGALAGFILGVLVSK